MYKQAAISILSSTLLLAGCGGGGGSSSSTSNDLTYDGPTAAVTISSLTEADTLAGTIIAMETDSSSLLGDATSLAMGVSVSSDASGSMDLDSIGDITRKLSTRAIAIEPGPMMLAGVTQTSTDTCDPYNGSVGSVTATVTLSNYNDIDGWTPTNGDSFSMRFSNCFMYDPGQYDLSIGELLNGSMSLVFTDVSLFDPAAINPAFSARFSFSNISAVDTSTGDKDWLHGGFTASFSGDGINTAQQFSFSGNSLIVQQLSGGITESAQLSSFSFVDTLALNGDFTFDHDYTIASTEIGGSVTVNMNPSFNVLYGDTYPSSGTVVMEGAGGAKIRLTAIDSTQAYIEYDLDGIAGYELTATKPWTEL